MISTASALVKALEERLFDPVLVDTNVDTDTVSIAAVRRDEVDDGTIVAVWASWRAGKQVDEPTVWRRHGSQVLVGYRDLMTELRTGVKPETAVDRVTGILGGLYVDTVKATDAEIALGKAIRAADLAISKAIKERDAAERAARKAAKAAEKEQS